jgi:hypothetical protein
MQSLKRLSLLILLLLAPVVLSQNRPEINPLNIGDEIHITQKKGEMLYFTFNVGWVQADFDLTIMARPSDFWSDQEIYVSTVNMHPSNVNTSEYHSRTLGYESIIIGHDKIRAGQNYYIGMACVSETCDYNLTIDYAKDVFVKHYYTGARISFVTKNTLVLRFEIPEDHSINRIVFSSEILNVNEL